MIFATSLVFYSCNKENVVTPQNVPTHGEYDIELLPGQTFQGTWYYKSNGSPITGTLTDINNVSWLNLTHADFTAGDCSNLGYVLFNFTAPATAGNYNTIVKHSNTENFNMKVNLTVTDNPSTNIQDSSFTMHVGDTLRINYDITYIGITVPSLCSNYFIPSNTQNISFNLFPTVNWLVIQPNNYSLGLNQTLNYTKTFTFNSSGTYTTMEVKTLQWRSWPRFTKWTVVVTP